MFLKGTKEVYLLRLWLKEKRTEKGLKQEEVAEQASISRSYYTQIELGNKIPTPKVALKLAEILEFDWTIFLITIVP